MSVPGRIFLYLGITKASTLQNSSSDLLIIGAGLTGLSLAYFLRNSGLKIHLLEARERVGGRIHTLYPVGQAPLEMGATWLGKKHTALVSLLDELGIATFEQQLGGRAIYEPISTSPHQLVQLPANDEPSYRISGGTTALIKHLAKAIPPAQLQLGTVVQRIKRTESGVEVISNRGTFTAKKVVSTLPPNLLASTIAFEPALPSSLQAVMHQTHTWMGDSIKISLSYTQPFWRKPPLSGTVVSNVGPIPELYDHANVEDTAYALKGFLNGAYFSATKAQRLQLVLRQLEKYYGSQVRDFIAYEEAVWREEPYTFAPYQHPILPHQNGGHELYQRSYWDNRLFIAGSETARAFPGYMNGAVQSARYIAQILAPSTDG
ncbi:MAG: NAD(P)/FAD-dependent oxidoreductase [Bacteroidota bacterium]